MGNKECDYINKWAKKIKAINYLGGKCKECGEDNIFVLCFHHKNSADKDKRFGTKSVFFEYRWSIVEAELKKCILLCNNCHREYHQNKRETERKNGKIRLLEIKGNKSCEICGYDKCNDSLTFHHKNGDKKLSFGDISKAKNISIKDIEDEMNKCDLLCSNCHTLKHIKTDRFDGLKEQIYQKSENIREKPPIDIEIVRKMLEDGKRQVEIRKELEASKSTICCIVRRIWNEAR